MTVLGKRSMGDFEEVWRVAGLKKSSKAGIFYGKSRLKITSKGDDLKWLWRQREKLIVP